LLASLTRMRGGPSTERRTGCFCRHPVGVLSGARQALVRRLASLVRGRTPLGAPPWRFWAPVPRFLLRHLLRIRPASSSQPGPSACRAGSLASRGKRLPPAHLATPLLPLLHLVSAADT